MSAIANCRLGAPSTADFPVAVFAAIEAATVAVAAALVIGVLEWQKGRGATVTPPTRP